MDQPRLLVKEPETLMVARFQDCDPFGHLNNARYLDYFLNARQDQIAEHYDLRTYEKGMQSSWVIRKTQIAYVRPVVTMEEILVRTRLLHFDETSLVVEGLMLERDQSHLKALIWFDFVHISLSTGRPIKHAQALMDMLGGVVIRGDYEPNGFNRRVEVMRRQARTASEKVTDPTGI
ncbi:MAG TPA: acyl-CoA thioesterase [Anaerolineales bacterium]|jgi:acyl-CoA thioester hydrolase